MDVKVDERIVKALSQGVIYVKTDDGEIAEATVSNVDSSGVNADLNPNGSCPHDDYYSLSLYGKEWALTSDELL